MTREELIVALTKMGVTVPDEWTDEQIEQTYEELKDAEAAEPAFRWRPGSPRG